MSDDVEPRLHRTLGARAVRILDWVNVAILAPIAYIIHLQRGGQHPGWLTSYGADVLGTAWIWWGWRRTVFARARAPAEATVVTVLLLGVVWEWCQRFDLSGTILSGTQGTFDPWDIVAYAVTLAGCYALERLLQRRAQAAARTAESGAGAGSTA